MTSALAIGHATCSLADCGRSLYQARGSTVVPVAFLDGLTSFLDFWGKVGGHALDWVQHPEHIVRDLVDLFWTIFFPQNLLSWFTDQFTSGGVLAGGVYSRLYHVTQPVGAVIAATLFGLRVTKAVSDPKVPAAAVILDTLPRLIVSLAAIAFGFDFITYAISVSGSVGNAMFTTLVEVLGIGDFVKGGLATLIGDLLTDGTTTVIALIGVIPLALFLLYDICLMMVRLVMLGFAIAVAPIGMATFAYDAKNRTFVAWLNLFVGSLMIPIVMGACFGVTVAVALASLEFPVVGSVMEVVIMCGGLWLGGKLVHRLTSELFSHGGAASLLFVPSRLMFSIYEIGMIGGMLASGGIGAAAGAAMGGRGLGAISQFLGRRQSSPPPPMPLEGLAADAAGTDLGDTLGGQGMAEAFNTYAHTAYLTGLNRVVEAGTPELGGAPLEQRLATFAADPRQQHVRREVATTVLKPAFLGGLPINPNSDRVSALAAKAAAAAGTSANSQPIHHPVGPAASPQEGP